MEDEIIGYEDPQVGETNPEAEAEAEAKSQGVEEDTTPPIPNTPEVTERRSQRNNLGVRHFGQDFFMSMRTQDSNLEEDDPKTPLD